MNRNGFSLIEIIVGMLIFAVGVLALSASTGYVSLQLQSADLRTERNAAYQQVAEQLHAMQFDNVVSQAPGVDVGEYSVSWSVQSLSWALKEIELYNEGPGFNGGRRVDSVTDTLIIRIARPVN